MSIFSRISKEIGWDPPAVPVTIPTQEWASILVDAVRAGSEQAFKMLFRIHRFAPSPSTHEELVAAHELHDAFVAISDHYRSIDL